MSYKPIISATASLMAAVAFPSCAGRAGFEFMDGDLVFCVAEQSGMSSAVAASTAWDDSLKFDHVAMVVCKDGVPYILEATSSKGVALTPWDEFYEAAADMDGSGGKGLVVKRVGRDFPSGEAVARAYERLGQEYDWHFLPDNGCLYCSELIYECYREEDGSPMFSASPMNFRDKEGNMPQFWTELFKRLGEPVPEGAPGTNPNDMAAAPFLVEVHRFFGGRENVRKCKDDAHEELEKTVRDIVARAQAEVGVYVLADGRELLSINDSGRYPMCSVFKLHQAVAVLDSMERAGISLDTEVKVGRDELKKDTWSPLRDRCPDADLVISYRDLLGYSVVLSDNNACDILFSRFGGPGYVDRYLRHAGLSHFRISATEDRMHKDLSSCYENWTRPSEAAALLDMLCSGDILSDEDRSFLHNLLVSCSTGTDRLLAPLAGTGAILGHKTGTGDLNADGRIIGLNDAGYVILPDGRRYVIAVFIKDSACSPEASASVIADISRAVYAYVSGGPVI